MKNITIEFAAGSDLNLEVSNDSNLKDIIEYAGVNSGLDIGLGVVVQIDDSDVSGLNQALLESLVPGDGATISIDMCNETEAPDETTNPEAGIVTFQLSGGMVQHRVPIVAGATLASALGNTMLQAVAGMTATELGNLQASRNGETITATTRLNGGDIIMLQQRVAGCKGANICVHVEDNDLGDVLVSLPAGSTLDTLLRDRSVSEKFGGKSYGDLKDAVNTIDDSDVSGIVGMLLNAELHDDTTISFSLDFVNTQQDTTEESSQAAPAAGTAGAVQVVLNGGMTSVAIPIVVGTTTVKDVVTNNRVLMISGQSVADVDRCTITANDQPVQATSMAVDGATYKIQPRVAGCKGC